MVIYLMVVRLIIFMLRIWNYKIVKSTGSGIFLMPDKFIALKERKK